jgi:hypothetical protein
MLRLISWPHNPEQRVTAHIFQWKIDEVRFRIDSHRMGMGHIELPKQTEIAIALLEHR